MNGRSEDAGARGGSASGMLIDPTRRWYAQPCMDCGARDLELFDGAVTCPQGHRVERSRVEAAMERAASGGAAEPDAQARLNGSVGSMPLSSSSSSSLTIDDDDDELRRLRDKRILSLSELRRLYDGTVDWVIPGYIAKRELTELAGPQESLKSWFVADLARAVLTGGECLGSFKLTQGKVIYIEGERANNLVYQCDLIEQAYGEDLAELMVIPPGRFFLRDRASQELLRSAVQEIRPSLIVLNSFRSLFRGKAADGIEIADALGWLGQLAETWDLAVVMIDQVNKAGATGVVRGTAAHADSLQKEYEADAVLHVERDRDAVGRGIGPARVYVGKRRAGEAGPAFSFEVRPMGEGAAPIFVEEITVGQVAPRPKMAEDRVFDVLGRSAEPISIETVMRLVKQDGGTAVSLGTLKNTLTKLKNVGKAEQYGRGLWRQSSSSSSLPREDDDDDDRRPDDDDIP